MPSALRLTSRKMISTPMARATTSGSTRAAATSPCGIATQQHVLGHAERRRGLPRGRLGNRGGRRFQWLGHGGPNLRERGHLLGMGRLFGRVRLEPDGSAETLKPGDFLLVASAPAWPTYHRLAMLRLYRQQQRGNCDEVGRRLRAALKQRLTAVVIRMIAYSLFTGLLAGYSFLSLVAARTCDRSEVGIGSPYIQICGDSHIGRTTEAIKYGE